MITSIILGILIWQAVVTATYLISNSEDTTIQLGAGVFGLVMWAVGRVYNLIRLLYYKSTYNMYTMTNKDTLLDFIYLPKTMESLFRLTTTEQQEPYALIKTRDGKEFKGAPNAHIIRNMNDFQYLGYSESFMKKYLKEG